MNRLTVVTGNPGKAAELSRLLQMEVDHRALDLPEVQSTSVREVVAAKAQAAYEQLGRPVVVDDAGLTIKAWGDLPGALIKFFIKNDHVGPAGIIKMLGDSPRQAMVEVALGYCDERGVQVAHGVVDGQIPDQPRGSGGFGFDTIFVPDGHIKTFGEMTAAEKDACSMRRLAVDQLKSILQAVT
jgi:XTP/dITP diphosphohydrolase